MDVHVRGTTANHGPRALIDGGPGRHDIVDEQDARFAKAVVVYDGERAGHVDSTSRLVEVHLRVRRARASQGVCRNRSVEACGDVTRQEQGLIEAAPPQAFAMEGNRYDHIVVATAKAVDGSDHAPQSRREGHVATVLESLDDRRQRFVRIGSAAVHGQRARLAKCRAAPGAAGTVVVHRRGVHEG